MRFLATADWQLGMAAHFLDADARPRYLRARFDAVRRIGQVARQRGAAFVLVCGDVFESNQLDRSVVPRAFEALKEFTVPVLLLPGNHDPLDAASVYEDPAFVARMPDQVRVLREPGVVRVAPGVEVVAAPWFSKRPGRDLVAEVLAGLDPAPVGTARILAAHGAVASLSPDAADPALVDDAALIRAMDTGVIDVAVLGDRHSTTQVRAGDPRLWYPGTPEVTRRTEVDPGNVLLIDVPAPTGAGPAGPRGAVHVDTVPVGRWRFRVFEQTLESADDVAELARRLDAVESKDRTAVWLALSGTLTMADNARLEQVLEQNADLFALLTVWERHRDLAVIPDDHDFADLRLGGFVDDAVRELAALAQDSADDARAAEDAQGALRVLYRLARSGEGAAR